MKPALSANRVALLLIAPAALYVGMFLLLPYVNILVMSFRNPGSGRPYEPGFTFANYARIFSDTFYPDQLANSVMIGIITTVLCLLLGFPVAWRLARGPARFRGLAYGLVLSPLLIGIVIRTYGWTILLGNNGLINRALFALGLTERPIPLMYNTLGVIIALVHVFVPFMILPVMSTIQGIDPSLEAAGRSLGASRAVIFRRIILPLAVPGIQAGCILVFVLSVSAYATPAVIGGLRLKTVTVSIVDALLDTFQWPFGSALALVLSATVGAVVLIFTLTTRMKWKA